MPNKADTQLTHEIRLNGTKILSGDETSTAVVFFNLSGKNFENPPVWQEQTHAQYLTWMESDLKVSFAGAKIEFAPVGRPAIETHAFA